MDENSVSGFIDYHQGVSKSFSQKDCYKLVKLLNKGAGYSCISLCRRNGKLFAAKSIKPEFQNNPIYASLLEKEYDITFSLDHPNICKTYDYTFIEELGVSIIMEYVDGLTLRDWYESDSIDEKFLFKFLSEICSAMEYCHKRQIIHRDIKPENIIITNNGNNVKLIDFGFSDSDSFELLKNPAGTKYYASPEQLRGEILDQRSDIYSIGITLSSITSQKRYQAVFRKVIKGCVSPDKERRFSSVTQISSIIESYNKTRRHGNNIIASTLQTILVIISIVVFYIFYSNLTHNNKESSFPENAIITRKDSIAGISNTISENNLKEFNLKGSHSVSELSVAETYFECYKKIDEYLNKFSETLRERYDVNIEEKIPNFSRDSIKASEEMNIIIKRLYSIFPSGAGNSFSEYIERSSSWAALALNKTINSFRADYYTAFANKISDSYNKSEEINQFSSPHDWYNYKYPSVAKYNLEQIMFHF